MRNGYNRPTLTKAEIQNDCIYNSMDSKENSGLRDDGSGK